MLTQKQFEHDFKGEMMYWCNGPEGHGIVMGYTPDGYLILDNGSSYPVEQLSFVDEEHEFDGLEKLSAPVAGVDYDRDAPMCQDDYERLTGTGQIHPAPYINMIETEANYLAHGVWRNKVDIRRGAHWYHDEDGHYQFTSGPRPTHTYYDVKPASMVRIFCAQMKLIEKGRDE